MSFSVFVTCRQVAGYTALCVALFAFALLPTHTFAQDTKASKATESITVEDIWKNFKFYPKSARGFSFLNDGKLFSRLEPSADRSNVALNAYRITDGTLQNTIVESKTIGATFDNYEFSSDEQKILLATETEKLYRHSSFSRYLVYDRATNTTKPLSDNGAAGSKASKATKQRLVAFSPKGDKVAFVRENNLFYKDLATDKETQVTTDGKVNEIINGAPDWVYEEEFSMSSAFEWSKDGQHIGFLRFDESRVKEVTLTLYDHQLYPTYASYKYPKAGEENSKVTAHVYNLATAKTTKVNIGDDLDYYLPRLKWTAAGKLCVVKMNRHQNDLTMLLADPTSGETTTLLHQQSPTYIDIAPGVDVRDNLDFLEDGKHFVWQSEESGYNHLYLYTFTGEKKALTEGKWEVTKYYGVDEKRNLVYFQSNESGPMSKHLYSVQTNGKEKRQLVAGDGGVDDAEFSKTFDYFVCSHSTANTPPTYTVYATHSEATGKVGKMREIETNEKLTATMKNYDLSPVEFFKFKTDQDVELNGYIIKPRKMEKGRKYPVLMHVYGGPASQQVVDSWNAFDYWWYQMLANEGYIIVNTDGRGTGGRGNAFKTTTYKQLGKLEAQDQIETAKWLGKQDYVDAKRIGIWGWSFGGYLSLLTALKGNDLFKACIAVAPVTNWKWYDSVYTERFLTTPAENREGYEDNSPVNFADRLRANLLLMHGDADDNVHLQNSAEMAAALIDANKQYDTYIYPNKDHSIFGGFARTHLYTKMTAFLRANL